MGVFCLVYFHKNEVHFSVDGKGNEPQTEFSSIAKYVANTKILIFYSEPFVWTRGTF